VQWDRNYTSSEVEDRRSEGGAGLGGFGGGGGGGLFALVRVLSMFGWKGIVVGLIIAGAVMVGGNFTHHAAVAPNQPVQSTQQETELVHFVSYVFDDVQRTWKAQMPDYHDAHLVLFRNAIRSACGTASTAVGPFYCQVDEKVYIDLAFYDELRKRFGAPGDYAQAYVIAHEVGHHIQKQRGLLGHGSADSVHVELQADCFAGAWAKDADRRHLLETGDIDEALNAAAQIGDDTLQKKAQGYVQPEKFTHGTSAQRKAAFQRGDSGGADACLAQ
jgi:predicted metalloprotease